MPKVVGYTPPWLSQPSPGARIFSDPEVQQPASPSKRNAVLTSSSSNATFPARRKQIVACRGSEVFTVVGNKIRWADLSRVKDEWEEQSHKKGDDHKPGYRTLKTSVYYQITGLTVSPSGIFLAISTEHSVYLATIPDSSRLNDHDSGELKLKTYQLGPTTHVIPEAPLAAVLWHPLAVSSPSGDCLVTVTTDASVRLWEVDRTNHWSFERPALAVDLRKLADGTSSDQNFEPSGFGKNRGFSVDAFDMEVAAATFGGRCQENEDPWASMTLWTAMTNGDIYALCPLLPSIWRSTSTTIPSLTTSAISRIANTQGAGEDERRAADQCYEWVQELDDDAPATHEDDSRVHARPQNPSAIPRLQGPFAVDVIDEETEVVDLFVIPSNLDEDELFSGEDDYEFLHGVKSLPFTVLSLATTESKVHILLDLEGVSGQWLPKHGRNTFSTPSYDAGELITLQTLLVSKNPNVEASHPTFTADTASPYEFFVTTNEAVFSLSLEDWASRVGVEVNEIDEVDSGLHTRLALACQGEICVAKEVLPFSQISDKSSQVSTPTLIDNINLGSLLLTTTGDRALAAQINQNSLRTSRMAVDEQPLGFSSPFRASQSLIRVLDEPGSEQLETIPTRAPYAPSQIFYSDPASAVDELKSRIPQHRRSLLKEQPLRLSPACLDVMTAAHRTFSVQTSNVEKAAAELFRRCERLREELADQVRQMAELGERLRRIQNLDEDDSDSQHPKHGSRKSKRTLDERIDAAKQRQKDLVARYEAVRKKAGKAGTSRKELSIKEEGWIKEVESLGKYIDTNTDENAQDDSHTESLKERYDTVKALSDDILEQWKALETAEAGKDGNKIGTPSSGASRLRQGLSLSSKLQREKIAEVMAMLEREGAIIEATAERLSRLSTS